MVSKGMYWESKANLDNQRLGAALDRVEDADQKAKEVDAKAHATDEKVALAMPYAITDFKNLEDFKAEVGEAINDAYPKDFF